MILHIRHISLNMKAPINQKAFIFKLIFTNMVVYICIFRLSNFFKDMITEKQPNIAASIIY